MESLTRVLLQLPGSFDLDQPNSYYDIVLLDFGDNAFSTYYPMFGGDDQTAYEVVMVGYGNHGSYSSDDPFGWTPVANSWFSQRRAGRNVMLPERVGGTEPQTYISSDFDHPEFNYDPVEDFDRFDDGLAVEDECQLLGGDSGGPSFVYRNGAWHVIGRSAGADRTVNFCDPSHVAAIPRVFVCMRASVRRASGYRRRKRNAANPVATSRIPPRAIVNTGGWRVDLLGGWAVFVMNPPLHSPVSASMRT